MYSWVLALARLIPVWSSKNHAMAFIGAFQSCAGRVLQVLDFDFEGYLGYIIWMCRLHLKLAAAHATAAWSGSAFRHHPEEQLGWSILSCCRASMHKRLAKMGAGRRGMYQVGFPQSGQSRKCRVE